jgi:hypothetical protein
MRPDGSPALIDFQSAVSTLWMPASWRAFVEAIDLSGVYKKWLARDAASMGTERLQLVERMSRWRRLWVLRGYAGVRKSPKGAGRAP